MEGGDIDNRSYSSCVCGGGGGKKLDYLFFLREDMDDRKNAVGKEQKMTFFLSYSYGDLPRRWRCKDP